jgi:MFS family permease
MTRTERTYYAVFGLYSLPAWFMGPVYPLFLLSRGLDLFQINVVLATFLITCCLLEVPTGALADVIGRKASFLLSCAVRTLAFGLYAFTRSFTDCVVAECVDAVGSTLANGALDAWAVDGMRAEGHRGSVDRFFARAQMMARVAMMAGGIACGYLAEYRIELPWLVAAGGFAVTGLVSAVLMRERHPATPADLTNVCGSLGQTVRDGLTTVRGAPVLLLLCGLSMAAAFGSIPAHMLWQARLQALTGEGVWLMGWIWALLNVAAIPAAPSCRACSAISAVSTSSARWRSGAG